MAHFRKRGRSWQALIERSGHASLARSFPTKAAAVAWATGVEGDMLAGRHGTIVQRTLGQALQRYAREVSSHKRGARWEKIRLAKLERDLGCAALMLEDVQAKDLASWRDNALAGRLPDRVRRAADGSETRTAASALSEASVRREMGLLRSVFEIARKEWGWIRANPLQEVTRPPSARPRTRIWSPGEIGKVLAACGYERGERATTATARIGAAFACSLETGMRAGELCGLTWDQVFVDARYVQLNKTKNGDERAVPLSKAALAILNDLPRQKGDARALVFGVEPKSLDALFRRARDRTGVSDATFHDARATFATRIAKKVDVLELARILGHRDPRSLMIYYRPSPAELAAKLD